MPLPLAGAMLGGAARRVAGRALRWATRGKLIGQGGGRALAGRVAQGAAGAATASEVARALGMRGGANAFGGGKPTKGKRSAKDDGEPRKYRRMNVGNGRALRRAVRRVEMFERMARRVFTVTQGTLKLRKSRRS